MISTARMAIVGVSVLLGSHVVAFEHAGRQSQAGPDDNALVQIIESCGKMGDFVVGQQLTLDMIVAHSLMQRPNSPTNYFPPNALYMVTVGTGKKIEIISTYVAGAFTQRYIVIGKSTLGDVLARYGQTAEPLPRPVNNQYRAIYDHEGIQFGFTGAVSSFTKVDRVALYRKFLDKNRPSTPCNPRLFDRK